VKAADICLGIFGSSDKTNRVVPNKIIESIAMAKPVITDETTAVKSFFTHGENIFLCKTNDAESLANAILTLHNDKDLLKKIGESRYKVFKNHFSEEAAKNT